MSFTPFKTPVELLLQGFRPGSPDHYMHCLLPNANPDLWGGAAILTNGHWLFFGSQLQHEGRPLNKLFVTVNRRAFANHIGIPPSWRMSKGAQPEACGADCQPAFDKAVPSIGVYAQLAMDECQIRCKSMYSSGAYASLRPIAPFERANIRRLVSTLDPLEDPERTECTGQLELKSSVEICLGLGYFFALAEMGMSLYAKLEETDSAETAATCYQIDSLASLLIAYGTIVCGVIMPCRP